MSSIFTKQGADGRNLPHAQPVSGSVVGSPFTLPTQSLVTDAEWNTPSGQVVTITSAGSNLPVISANAVFEVLNHSNSNNNGLYQETGGSPTIGSISRGLIPRCLQRTKEEISFVFIPRPLAAGRYNQILWMAE